MPLFFLAFGKYTVVIACTVPLLFFGKEKKKPRKKEENKFMSYYSEKIFVTSKTIWEQRGLQLILLI